MNENIKIKISDLLKTKEFLIIEYTVTAEDTNYFNQYEETREGLQYSLLTKIELNKIKIEEKTQITEKIDEKSAKVYDIITLTNLKFSEENEIIIKIFKTEKDDFFYKFVPDSKSEKIEFEYSDEEYEIIDENYSEDDKQEKIKIEEEKEDKLLKIKINKTEIEAKTKVEKTRINQEILPKFSADKTEKINDKILIISATLKDTSSNDIYDIDAIDPSNIKLNIQDEKGNTINITKLDTVDIILEDGTDWLDSEKDDFKNATAFVKTFVILNKQRIKKAKVQANYIKSYTLSDDDINEKKWYKIVDGKYTGKHSQGGTLQITKIEITDKEIIFNYKTEGFIPEEEPLIIIRNIKKQGYRSGKEIRKTKGLNQIIFQFDNESVEKELQYIDQLENLEFAIFEDYLVKTIGTAFEINI